MLASEIDFFESLSQYDYNGQHYDFHNDYDCEELLFSQSILTLRFRHLETSAEVSLVFSDVHIIKTLVTGSDDMLTIDTLYRGKCEEGKDLFDVTVDGWAYFYLEFYNGQQFEFWARELDLNLIA